MQKTLRVMDHTGDTKIEFDTADPVATEKARAEFDALMKRNATVVTFPKGGTSGEQVRKFEDLQESSVVIPAIVAG